jgi:hypothetical protein
VVIVPDSEAAKERVAALEENDRPQPEIRIQAQTVRQTLRGTEVAPEVVRQMFVLRAGKE